jgi:hypothetical protein
MKIKMNQLDRVKYVILLGINPEKIDENKEVFM